MNEEKKLFNENDRDYIGPSPYVESQFDYLNRSARPEFKRIRNLLERWFKHFPSEAQDELGARFQSKDDRHHLAAFFELYLHELLSKSGFDIETHPKVNNKATHPDFKVLKDGEPLFYLEASLAAMSDADRSAKARENRIYDAINRIKSPNFFIGLKVHGALATDPPSAELHRFLEDKLSNLDPDVIAKQFEQGGQDALPQWDWEHDGWQITFFPIPKKPEARGKPGVRPIELIMSDPHWVTPHVGIRESIKDKNSKYGELDLPYIVAINVIDELGANDIDISNALFGEEQVTIIFRGNKLIEQRLGRKPNGAWYGPKGPWNKRVSAASIVVNLLPWSIAKVTPVLWHNPWASRPLSPELLPFPKFLAGEDNHLKEFKGKNSWELLGLDPNWPETYED